MHPRSIQRTESQPARNGIIESDSPIYTSCPADIETSDKEGKSKFNERRTSCRISAGEQKKGCHMAEMG